MLHKVPVHPILHNFFFVTTSSFIILF